MGLVFLFFVALFSLLAVFYEAKKFNQDVSKWNTGTVTDMSYSKCTLSPSLWPRRLPFCGVYLRQLEVCRVTSLSHVFVVVVCVVLLHPFLSSCSVSTRREVQSGRVEMEYGDGDRYVIQ
jgi:surface protein